MNIHTDLSIDWAVILRMDLDKETNPYTADMDTEVDIEVEEEVDDGQERKRKNCLIVYNDDYNTFDHVIDTLMEVCQHSRHQAEQCTHIIHFRGKCCVKEGSYRQLLPMQRRITSVGIQAEIT